MSCRRGGKSRLQPMAGALRSIRLTPEQDMLIDTHVHFDEFLAGGEEEAVLERAVLAGVERMVAVGGSRESNCMAVDMARAHPDRIRAAIRYARDQARIAPPATWKSSSAKARRPPSARPAWTSSAIQRRAMRKLRCSIQCWTWRCAGDCR